MYVYMSAATRKTNLGFGVLTASRVIERAMCGPPSSEGVGGGQHTGRPLQRSMFTQPTHPTTLFWGFGLSGIFFSFRQDVELLLPW